MRNRIVLIITSFLFVITALLMIYSKEKVLTEGTVIELETQPVDPRDLLRGDYVILDYKINHIKFEKDFGAVNPGKDAFVQLEQKGRYWEAKKAYTFPQNNMGIFLKGRLKRQFVLSPVRVDYGIESYFVPEGKGKQIEETIRRRGSDKITVEVAVDKEGKAVIKQLLLNGQPYRFSEAGGHK